MKRRSRILMAILMIICVFFVMGATAAAKGWQTVGSKTYYIKSNGQKAKGWKKIKGKYYYFRKNHTLYNKKGWLKIGRYKYYIRKDGSRVNNAFYKVKKKKYYFNANGRLVTDKRAFKIGKKYYNISSKGVVTAITETHARCETATQQFIQKHTQIHMTNAEKFRQCFRYLLAYMRYRSQPFNSAEFKPKEWHYQKAIDIFESPTLSGNCYSFACAVASCARELGYDPYVIVTTGDHGFVMINGKYYDNMYGGLFGADSRPSYGVYKKVRF